MGLNWRVVRNAVVVFIITLVTSTAFELNVQGVNFSVPALLPFWQAIQHAVQSLWPAALVSAGLVTTAQQALEAPLARKWTRVLARLSERVVPDSGGYTLRIELRTASMAVEELSEQLAHIPADCREIVLVLKQISRRARDRRDKFELQHTIDQITRAHDVVNKKNKNSQTQTEFTWVYLVDRNGKLAAFQRYPLFWIALGGRGLAYMEILNTATPQDFADLLRDHYEAAAYSARQDMTAPITARITARLSNYIPTLELKNVITKGIRRRQALAYFKESGWDCAMLVSANDHKPLGVVSLRDLVDSDLIGEEKQDDDKKIEEKTDIRGESPAPSGGAPNEAATGSFEIDPPSTEPGPLASIGPPPEFLTDGKGDQSETNDGGRLPESGADHSMSSDEQTPPQIAA